MTVRNTVLRTFLQPCLCLLPLLLPASAFGEEGDGKSPEIETRIISFRQCTAWFNAQLGYAFKEMPVEVQQLGERTCELMHHHLFLEVRQLDHENIAPVYKYCFDLIEGYPGPEKLSSGVPKSMAMISCLDRRRLERTVLRSCYKQVPDTGHQQFRDCVRLRLRANAGELNIPTGGMFDELTLRLESLVRVLTDEFAVQRRSMFFMDHFATNTSYRCRYIPDQDRYFDCALTEVLPKYGE